MEESQFLFTTQNLIQPHKNRKHWSCRFFHFFITNFKEFNKTPLISFFKKHIVVCFNFPIIIVPSFYHFRPTLKIPFFGKFFSFWIFLKNTKKMTKKILQYILTFFFSSFLVRSSIFLSGKFFDIFQDS